MENAGHTQGWGTEGHRSAEVAQDTRSRVGVAAKCQGTLGGWSLTHTQAHSRAWTHSPIHRPLALWEHSAQWGEVEKHLHPEKGGRVADATCHRARHSSGLSGPQEWRSANIQNSGHRGATQLSLWTLQVTASQLPRAMTTSHWARRNTSPSREILLSAPYTQKGRSTATRCYRHSLQRHFLTRTWPPWNACG